MRPADVYELTGAGDPRLSPDGSTAAYVVWRIDREEAQYRMAIWLAPVDGSAPPRQFTAGETRDTTPRWSPDGGTLAFLSSRGADEKQPGQLWTIPVAGGEPRRLTELKEDVQAPVWSPDGTRIAFAARVRAPEYEEEDDRKRAPRRFTRLLYKLDNVGWIGDRRTHVFVVPADGSGEPKQLTSGDFEHGAPSWSSDGSKLVFAAARSDDWDVELVQDLYVLDADGGEPERLTPGDGTYGGASYSPDGRYLAYRFTPGVHDFPFHTQIGVLDLETGERRLLTESLDRQCEPYPELREPIWDGGRIVFGVEDGGNVHLYTVAPDGSAPPERLLDGEQVLNGYDVRDGRIVTTQSTAPALFELHADGRRLSDHGASFARGRELVEPERYTATSPDGAEVDCWLVRPAGFEEGRRYPVLLTIHGGPFTQYGTGFFDEAQVYAGGGYAVVYCNPRGSSGYSEAWGRAIRGPSNGQGPGWGTVDYEDVIACLDTALERYDFLDPERCGVLGGSYGGFMTSWIVGHTDRFRAAISERAVNNLVSAFGSSDMFWAFQAQFGSRMFDEVETWLDRSPTTYAKNIETPLLIMHSDNDLRCNVEQGEHLFIMLRLLRKEVELLRFPAESHELSRSGSPVHRVQRFEAILEWFDRYLAPERTREREPALEA